MLLRRFGYFFQDEVEYFCRKEFSAVPDYPCLLRLPREVLSFKSTSPPVALMSSV